MGTNYRARLRARGIPDPPRGRPPYPDPAELIRWSWTRLSDEGRAAFMAWAGLREDADDSEGPERPETTAPHHDC